ncbi:MAG: flavodoxin family protein [Oscillospiraceae bacterium]
MNAIIVKECGDFNLPNVFTLDLNKNYPKDCLGCWSCWWTTPGRCVHKDLDGFYRSYLKADKAIFFAKLTHDFVSGNMKSLFDRMICLFLPYITFLEDGRSGHLPRYDKYPDIEFYYDGTFDSEESKKTFEDYINFVFFQFYSKKIVIKPISQYDMEVQK